MDYSITKKAFTFPKKHGMPFYFVSASDGTNVVKVCKCGILRTSLYLLYSVRRIGGGGLENIEYIFKLEQR